jgi:hypothetical protein
LTSSRPTNEAIVDVSRPTPDEAITESDVDDELARKGLLARRVVAAVLILAATAVWFLMAPSNRSRESEVDVAVASALTTDATNQRTATTAPQRQVVNGWTARDLLALLAREQANASTPSRAPLDDRVPAELALVVIGIAFFGALGRRPT